MKLSLKTRHVLFGIFFAFLASRVHLLLLYVFDKKTNWLYTVYIFRLIMSGQHLKLSFIVVCLLSPFLLELPSDAQDPFYGEENFQAFSRIGMRQIISTMLMLFVFGIIRLLKLCASLVKAHPAEFKTGFIVVAIMIPLIWALSFLNLETKTVIALFLMLFVIGIVGLFICALIRMISIWDLGALLLFFCFFFPSASGIIVIIFE